MGNYTTWPEDGTLPEHVQKFLDWTMLPKQDREPATEKAWAEANDWNPATVRQWKLKPQWRVALRAAIAESAVSEEKLKSVMDQVYRNAENGDMKAVDTYLKWANQFKPQQHEVVEAPEIQRLTDAELAREFEMFLAGVEDA